jgi:uncharacterized DUF497 family protein
MDLKLTWDENKRLTNLQKHGLDFRDAGEVLESRYRFDLSTVRNGEIRVQSLSYVMGVLRVLSVAHTDRHGLVRVFSYRAASREETEAYYEWLRDE